MQLEHYNYLSGMCAAMYFVVCLLNGLQLCFGVFNRHRAHNLLLSRLVGGICLVMSCSAVCYMLSNLLDSEALMHIGVSIDILMFAGIACASYVLYSNNEPSLGKLATLVWPFVVVSVLNIFFPQWLVVLFNVAALVLLVQMVYFGVVFIRRERHLDDLYADPERHSLMWMLVFIGLFIGWWAVCMVFSMDSLNTWYDIAVYTYMSGIILFVCAKVGNHGEPVSLATQQQIEEGPLPTSPQRGGDNHNDNVTRLKELMEKERLYLNPDLTVEDVVKRLGTNTKYFSTMLHDDMHTTFSRLVNEYRVEYAKQLLQDKNEKVVNLAEQCGFNSNQSFFRTFAKYTGLTPTEWRNK